MTKMSNKHSLDFKKDPQADRRAVIDSMKGFKGSKFPANPFKDGKPKTQTDPDYKPFKGKVPK